MPNQWRIFCLVFAPLVWMSTEHPPDADDGRPATALSGRNWPPYTESVQGAEYKEA